MTYGRPLSLLASTLTLSTLLGAPIVAATERGHEGRRTALRAERIERRDRIYKRRHERARPIESRTALVDLRRVDDQTVLMNPDCAVVAVSGGQYGMFAVASDGTVWSWGSNRYFTLGRADEGFRTTSPVVHPRLAGVAAVESNAAARFALAVHSDGTVSSWGSATCGLGDGSTTESATPLMVNGLTGITNAALGSTHALALRNDGVVFAWGCNNRGQLGDGSSTPSALPVQVSALTNVVAVAAGRRHSLALLGDGTVWAWGENLKGQLGDGSQIESSIPVQASGIGDATAIAAGRSFSLALRAGQTLLSWGENDLGQLGDGSRSDSSTPVAVGLLTGVAQIAAGSDAALAVRADGTVVAWGDNYYLQAGIPKIELATPPVDIAGLTDVVSAALGDQSSIALKGDGTVVSWGAGHQLGNGHNEERNTPVATLTGGFTRIDAGDYVNLALDSAGQVFGWGWNWSGMATGSATHEGISYPTPVTGMTGMIDIAAGFEHSLALDSLGQVWGWGSNWSGFLGDGTTQDRLNPVLALGIDTAVDLASGWGNSYAVLADGTVRAWGENDYGQLGDGSFNESHTPVTVVGLDQVVEIDCYEYHVVARKSDGTVWTWGAGGEGALGVGDFDDSEVPVQVVGLSNAVAVAAGGHFTMAALADGSVWGWGDGFDATLGPGRYDLEPLPVLVPDITSAVALTCEHGTAHALLSDATMVSWGGNYWGQLGTGRTDRLVPEPESPIGLANILAISGGEEHFIALAANGSISAAGYNIEGQLGDDDISATHLPVAVSFDATPLNQGNTLFAVRDVDDVVLDFRAASASAWRVYRDDTPQTIGQSLESPDLTVASYRDPAVISIAADYYYYLRGLSACSFTEGP